MPRRKAKPGESDSPPSFEEALQGLESIVEAMEHEQLPLEELVAYYEKGSALLDRCESVLQSARGRIELITLRNKGETAEPSTSSESTGTSEDDETDDDIRLF